MERSSIQSKAYNCDCLEYMRKLPDNYFDLAIADPPYGIGASRPSKKAERAVQPDGSILQVSVTDFTKKDWDNTIPSQEFFDELRRVSKNQIIWGANYFGLQGGMIVWDKINGNSDQYDCEIAYQSFNKRTDLVHYMWNGMFQGKYCGRDIRQAAVQQGNKALNEKRIHPTQKPVILYEWLLNNYAKKGDRIFDPMMGSQSSRIAARRLGFDYVGCELDKEYYDKGCARFDSEQMGNNKSVTKTINNMDKTSFLDSDTQKQINAPLNGTLIHGTHRMCDLIPAMLEAIRDTAEYAQLSSRLPSVVTDPSASEWDDRWQDDDVAYLHEELTDIMERYAPEGYYFGPRYLADGNDIGYWRDESYMLGVITESVKEGQTLILNEDPALTHRPSYSGEPTIINAYQITRNKEGVMVGNKTYMVNINDLDEDSIEKLFKAVKEAKAKSVTAKEAIKTLLPNSGIDFVLNSGKPYEIRMQNAVAHISAVHTALLPAEARGKEVYLYGNIVKEDGSTQPLNYLEDLPVSAQGQLVQYVKETLAKINSPEQLRQLIQERFDAFKADHGEEPLYAEVNIRFKDEKFGEPALIKLSSDVDPRDDNYVFFNCDSLNDLIALAEPDNGEDFYIVDVQDITFQPKILYLNDEKAMTLEQVQEKAVKLFGDNFEFDYWKETEAGTKIDRIDLGEMPDTISIDKLEIKDGQLSLYSNDIASDVDLQALDDIELSKVDVSLDEIKSFIDVKTLLTGVNDKLRNLLPDYGDHIFINEDLSIQRPDKNIRVFEVTYSLLVDTNEDVFVCGTTNGGFRLENLTSDELQKLNNILNEKKYNIFLSSNKEKDLVGRYQAAGMGNGTKFWPDRGTLGIYQAFAFKDNKILVFKDADDSKGVLLSSLPHEEQKYIMDSIGSLLDKHITSKELADAKAKLFATILEAKKDLGDEISIAPTEISENGDKHVITEIFPDFESPFEDQNIIGGVSHSGDEDCVNNLALCLENVNDAEALGKAVHEAHVKHLEQDAKQAIHDRIVTPSARRFTSDQVEVLNRYHQVAAQDKPAGEVFKELLQEVSQEPDVARKPEKWVTDTAKELDDLAKGITREESRGLHK